MAKYLGTNGVAYFWEKLKNYFVQKEIGKGLSEENFTSDEKVKLANLNSDNYVKVADKGQPNGVATLDSTGVVPSAQLPSFVDDIIEGYFYNDKFYTTSEHTTEIKGETGKIYVDLATNLSYRYGGTVFVQITSSDMVEITNSEIDEIVGA